MKRILALAAITVVTGCATWTTEQKVLGGASVALDAVDYATTKKCLSMPTCHEANPILGEHPSNSKLLAFKGGVAIAKLGIANALPTEWRTNFLYIVNAIQLGVDVHNAKVIGWNFKF